MGRVRGPTWDSTSATEPTATIRPPRTATAADVPGPAGQAQAGGGVVQVHRLRPLIGRRVSARPGRDGHEPATRGSPYPPPPPVTIVTVEPGSRITVAFDATTIRRPSRSPPI